METKYKRQLKSAQQRIRAKGTTVTWYKAGENEVVDPTPEFPDLAGAQDYPGVPAVFYPANRINQETVLYNSAGEQAVINLFMLVAGGLPFTPEESDAVVCMGELRHVTFLNITQPDGIPIIYEVGLR